MEKSLFNPHQEPRPFGMKTRRPNAVTRFLMALFVILLIPQGTWAADKVIYYKYDGTKFVEADADTYTLNPSSTTWSGGTIVITGTMNYDDRIEVTGDVDLVLCDQATLNAKRGIGVPVGATLTIYGQEKGTGELNARGYYYNVAQSANSFLYYGGAAIGGCHHGFNGSTAGTSYECGSVIIHGGIITADSSTSGTANDAAGIGGFGSAGPSELTVYGGKVTAKGGKYSAGIGGGGQSKGGGTVSIYGGEVIATGGAGDGADGTYGVAMGIGAGSLLNGPRAAAPSNGTLTLYPGATCYGGNNTTTADLTTGPVTVTTRDQYMKTVKSYDLWVSGIQVTEDNRTNIWSGTDISFNPVNSTLHYKDGGSTAYSVHSGLPSLTIRIGSPDGSTPPDYSKNNISIIKFGSPNKEAIAATGGTLTLSKEDNVAGVQQFDIVAYGSEPSLIQGFDDVTYSDFVIMQDGAVYNTTTKQLEYPNPNGSGYVGLDATTTFRTPQDISGFYVADIPNQDYTGSPLNANIIVKETETATPALVENTDYTVSYQLAGAAATPQDAKTYNVIITGKGLYTGSITAKTFTIDPASATITAANQTVTYNGAAQAISGVSVDKGTVSITYYDSAADRAANTKGYTTSPTNAGTYYVQVTQSDANYTSTPVDVTFTIGAKSLTDATIMVDAISSQTYNDGTAITPAVVVKDGGKPLAAGTDYTLNYSNNTDAALSTDASAPTVTITGTGNYTGEKTVKFTISPASATITATDQTVTYNGAAQAISGVSVDKGSVSVTYYNSAADRSAKTGGTTTAPTNAGTYYVQVTQTDANYTSTPVDVTFTIGAKSISGVSVAVNGTYTYTGAAVEPATGDIVVTDGRATLVDGTDYTITYNNNVNAGTAAEVIITGKGNYSTTTTKTQTFTINMAAGSISFANASVNKTFGDADFTIAASNTGDGTLTYASDNISVASVDASGKVTINGSGSATITATVADGTNYTYATKTASYTLTVGPASMTTTATGYTGAYDGNSHGITVTAPAGATVKYGTSAGTYDLTASPTYTDAGTYTVYYEVTKADYTAVTGSANVTISKAAATVTAPTAKTLTYTGKAQELVTAGSATGGTIEYSLDGISYSATIPTGTAATTYTVYYKVTGDANHNDVAASSVNVTIGKATGSISFANASVNKTFGDADFTIAASNTGDGTLTYASDNISVASVDASGKVTINGSGSATITATVADGTNYTYATKTVTYALTVSDRSATIAFTPGRTYQTFYAANETFLVPDGVTAYIVTGVNGKSVTVTKVSYIPAAEPVLLESTPGSTIAKDPSETIAGNLLRYAAKSVAADGNQYVLYSDEFVKASGTIDGKVFLDLTGLPSPARAFVIRTENATAIEDVFGEEADGDAKWYDMQGRRINKPTKAGLYIKDGKKVVVNKK